MGKRAQAGSALPILRLGGGLAGHGDKPARPRRSPATGFRSDCTHSSCPVSVCLSAPVLTQKAAVSANAPLASQQGFVETKNVISDHRTRAGNTEQELQAPEGPWSPRPLRTERSTCWASPLGLPAGPPHSPLTPAPTTANTSPSDARLGRPSPNTRTILPGKPISNCPKNGLPRFSHAHTIGLDISPLFLGVHTREGPPGHTAREGSSDEPDRPHFARDLAPAERSVLDRWSADRLGKAEAGRPVPVGGSSPVTGARGRAPFPWVPER